MASTVSPPDTPPSPRCHARPPASASSSGRQTSDGRRGALPPGTTRPLRPHPSSTSVAPSTAEGKAMPVDDAAARPGTLALREINSHFPSRRRWAKLTGAQPGTYSEPVVVRSYYSAAPSRRPRPSARGGAASKAHGPSTGVVGLARGGVLGTVARACSRKRPASDVRPEAQLPPVAAFRFRSFLASAAAAADINADLDRIAEICARSSYSLSNQYELHCAPPGPGAALLAAGHGRGPTAQADGSDDEQQHLQGLIKRRRRVGRGTSRAVGTLETIMSSSRSSDEENAARTSASEGAAAGVRGRAARKTQASGPSCPALSPRAARHVSESQDEHGQQQQQQQQPRPRRSSTSLALIDNARQTGAPASSWALVSEPALPQASGRQLETRTRTRTRTRTASANPSIEPEQAPRARASSAPRADVTEAHPARGSVSSTQQGTLGKTTGSSISGWLPSMSTSLRPKPRGRAESSLRDLLHSAEHKARVTASAAR
ncbi:hypothetical protein E4U53_004472 [Claviceps sorghi]|nr:hypothetical protein E4U53_004472 [Claviceps sorghi]